MNTILHLNTSSSAQTLLDAYRPDTPFFFSSPVHTLLAQGIFAKVPQQGPVNQSVRQALDQASAQGHPEPIAVGAIPFDVRKPAALSIARRLLRADALNARQIPPLNAGPYSTCAVPSSRSYKASVAQAVANIRSGLLHKVVLARTLELSSKYPINSHVLLARLAAYNTHHYNFAVNIGEGQTLLGASPELLVSRSNGMVRANPLAGSMPRSSNPLEDRQRAQALLASVKDQEEHRVVVEAVKASLAPLCQTLNVPDSPSLMGTPTMWHLSTEVSGTTEADALTLALALHPTPAVCGHPRNIAHNLISQIEPFDRSFYAGMLGWMDGNGDGEWIVTLRCAQVSANKLQLFAGAGVVSDSSPEGELAETTAKFRTMLDALGIEHESAIDTAAEVLA